ncbi:MAG: DUF669 domain-containing protein [Pirellulales bacterium]
MRPRKKLTDILRADQRDAIADAWADTEAASDLLPLPAGEYVCRLVAGELFTAKAKGTAGYKLTFQVLDGEHTGRKIWHDIWLTPAAMPLAKRDLAKLGITGLDQLERPLPPGIRCVVKVTLRKDDEGTEYNKVRGFSVVGIDPPDTDPFAPIGAPEPPQAVAGGAP